MQYLTVHAYINCKLLNYAKNVLFYWLKFVSRTKGAQTHRRITRKVEITRITSEHHKASEASQHLTEEQNLAEHSDKLRLKCLGNCLMRFSALPLKCKNKYKEKRN